jgi:hypothetical protein
MWVLAAHEVTIDVAYEDDALPGLIHPINPGSLRSIFEAVYERGLRLLVRVGVVGDLPGVLNWSVSGRLEPMT